MTLLHSIREASFDYVLTREACIFFFTCAVSHSSDRPEFILVRRNHIDCRQERPRYLGGLLSVSISFTTGASRSSFSLPDTRAFSFLLLLTLGSHSIRPSRSVVTARRLYKFYIIFMRHKVVEKPTEEKRERVRGARAGVRQRGGFSVQIIPLGTLSPPPVDTVVTWLGGADRTPSFSLVGVEHEERGKSAT